MLRVAYCESHIQQFRANGTVLDNKGMNQNGTIDYGVFGINSSHIQEALKLGLDIMTIQGNILYAKYLYDTQGMKPWSASFDCMKKAPDLSG